MRLLQGIVVIILTCYLTACGFHPRGVTNFSPAMQHIFIKSKSPYGELANNLREYFKMSGVYLAETPAEANIILEIISEETGRQLLGINSTQQTSQYNLTLDVVYQLTDPEGHILVAPQHANETRTLAINSNQILGGSNEEMTLYQRMRKTIVFDIVNRLVSQDITHQLAQHTTT